jgi:cation:H+ antiporter
MLFNTQLISLEKVVKMDLLISIILFIAGVILLYKGADFLVDGSAKTALFLGVSKITIAITIIAYGTSAPEAGASIIAALESHESISLGTIVGSCLTNFLLILGLCAIVSSVETHKRIIKREMPMMIVVAALLASIALFLGKITWFFGILFIILFSSYMVYILKTASKERENTLKLDVEKNNNVRKYILFIIVGLIGVIIGAKMLVDSSVSIAETLSIPPVVIALSVVSIGTSLPELAVSLLAAKKKEFDISVGNVIGSNIFNILFIIGICSIIVPIPIDVKSLFSMIFLLVVSLILMPILYTGYKISKIEGVLLLGLYAFYIYYLYSTLVG